MQHLDATPEPDGVPAEDRPLLRHGNSSHAGFQQDPALVCMLGRYQKAEGANQTLVVVVCVDKEKWMAIFALTR
jgi:hypothetical protein